MLRGATKRLAHYVISEDAYRVFYVAVTSSYLACLFYLWSPMPYVFWNIPQEQLRLFVLGKTRLHNTA